MWRHFFLGLDAALAIVELDKRDFNRKEEACSAFWGLVLFFRGLFCFRVLDF
jgi:hypothetical protein